MRSPIADWIIVLLEAQSQHFALDRLEPVEQSRARGAVLGARVSGFVAAEAVAERVDGIVVVGAARRVERVRSLPGRGLERLEDLFIGCVHPGRELRDGRLATELERQLSDSALDSQRDSCRSRGTRIDHLRPR